MKIELDNATLKTDSNMERIWKSRPADCTLCLTKVLLEPPQMEKYCVEMLTHAIERMFRDQVSI